MDVVEVLPQLHMLRFEVGQAYVWCDPGSLTLIDSGCAGSANQIWEVVRKLGYTADALHRVLLTHSHGDHVGSASEIGADTTVMAHRLDAPVIRGEVAWTPPVLTEQELPLYERIVPTVPLAPPARVDQELEDGDVVDFGGGARVVSVPGHTDGSIAFHLPQHRVLFTGDAVASADGRPFLGPFNIDRSLSIESMRFLAEFDARIACFGHGDPLVGDVSSALRTAPVQLPS